MIPPDRRPPARKAFDFQLFQSIWLDPIFNAFPKLAIHEAVYDELISPSVESYVREKLQAVPPRLIIHSDSTLNKTEKMLRDSIEKRIYPLTKYDPILDNRDDRGEVKTLAYIAVKELIYYLYTKNLSDKQALKYLYRYQYHLTKREKLTNPNWNEFVDDMNDLYQAFLKNK